MPYKTEILDYQDLLTCEKRGRKTHYIPKLDEDINVKQVLDGIDEQRPHDEKRFEPHRDPIPVTIQPTEQEKKRTEKNYFWNKWGALAAIIAAIIGVVGIILTF